MELTHFDAAGRAVMVDVSQKPVTHRTATACGTIGMSREAFEQLAQGTAGKGDVLGTARLAGIMAAKRTGELIPLCHPLPLTRCTVEFWPDAPTCTVQARCTAETEGRTGVEMEALTGASVALLTIYDMLKAIDRTMRIDRVCLVEKAGGRSGHLVRADAVPDRPAPRVAVSGVKGSGKTTLIGRLLPKLAQRGIRTAVIKHDGHRFVPDVPGTDSFRHFAAGAVGSAVFDDEKYSLTRRAPTGLAELATQLWGADLILVEGCKRERLPRIELVRAGVSDAPVCDPATLLALVTDLPLQAQAPVYGFDAIDALAGLLEAHVRERGEELPL